MFMSRRTVQTQRKSRIPSGLKKRPKKEKVEQAVAKVEEVKVEACEIPSCGCGN